MNGIIPISSLICVGKHMMQNNKRSLFSNYVGFISTQMQLKDKFVKYKKNATFRIWFCEFLRRILLKRIIKLLYS